MLGLSKSMTGAVVAKIKEGRKERFNRTYSRKDVYTGKHPILVQKWRFANDRLPLIERLLLMIVIMEI